MKQPAVFLDRDGTIIEDRHYIRNPDDVVLLPGAVQGLKQMRSKGYVLFVVSNQSGIGRGLIQDSEFLAVHQRVCELLQTAGVEIAEFAYCFHSPSDECQCRKPKPGLVQRSYQGVPIDLPRSFAVGDKESDLKLGDAVGAAPVLVLTGQGSETYAQLRARGREFTACSSLLDLANQLPSVL